MPFTRYPSSTYPNPNTVDLIASGVRQTTNTRITTINISVIRCFDDETTLPGKV